MSAALPTDDLLLRARAEASAAAGAADVLWREVTAGRERLTRATELAIAADEDAGRVEGLLGAITREHAAVYSDPDRGLDELRQMVGDAERARGQAEESARRARQALRDPWTPWEEYRAAHAIEVPSGPDDAAFSTSEPE